MILSLSGPQDLIIVTSVSEADTFMPVAQAPRENALSTNGFLVSVPAVRAKPTWSSCRVAARSSRPRTQLVGVPELPEDSSTTTPRRGSCPSTQRSGMLHRRTYDALSISGTPANASASERDRKSVV